MKYLISILFISFCYSSSIAQKLNKADVEKRIDNIFKELYSNKTPGVAITVLQNGKVIARKNYGMASLEHPIPFTHHSPTRLVYSFGREFICVGAALMEAEGLLSLDDKVRSYFPQLQEWSKNVTIQDLLNHSSGFMDEWSPFGFMSEDMRSTIEVEQVLAMLYNQPQPEVEPGKGYMYNNTDIGLLRLIMEKVSQQSLPDYLNKNLFVPLGMNQTLMNDNVEQIIPALADDYYGKSPYRKGRWFKFSPGGNYRMVTSAADLEKWAMAIEDKNSIVTKAYTRLYKNARSIPVVSPESQYVFGHEWHTVNNTEIVTYGGLGDFYIVRIPSQQISIVVLGNSEGHFLPTTKLYNSFLPTVTEVVPEKNNRFFPDQAITLTEEELEKYTGIYLTQTIGYNSHIPSIKLYTIKLDGSDLIATNYGSDRIETRLTPFGNGYFKDIQNNAFGQFTKTHPDSAMKAEFWLAQDRSFKLNMTRAEGSIVVNEQYLQQFTGQYYNAQLDYYFRIAVDEQGQLIIKRPTVRDVVMIPYSNDKFIVEGKTGAYSVFSWMLFTRNQEGEIDGFTGRDSRTMNFRCEKVK
jgi:CubicO group peptidase (beta-lactamase class C family)